MADGTTLGFADANLDRSAVQRTDEAWLAQRLGDPASRFICFNGERPVIDVSEPVLRAAQFTQQQVAGDGASCEPVLLGIDEAGTAMFAIGGLSDAQCEALAPEHKLIDLRSLALQGAMAPNELGLLAQARSLLHWHERHRFCANCGAPTEQADAGYRRSCVRCCAGHFPRTDPVVIMVIIHDDKCLLGRSPNFAEGMYSALAGFMEPGETMEDAARREVYEEAGIKVGKIDYILSQPWPFPSSLMIGLVGEALTGEIVIDPVELEDARWFGLGDIRDMLADQHKDGLRTPPPMAIAHHLVLEAIRRLS
ncbi:MAG: NAD(+) diphosphatase [Aestuariivirgaceae bacterium]